MVNETKDFSHRGCVCVFSSTLLLNTVLCLGMCGRGSWKPWLVSGAMEMTR
ncbi:unnamed protein product [Oncorhynchus mykiss]|uniref:Uncharacterized protein n=1 Tax=Oncorhynchus mykiss TaxID=8022 RepID=A0A061A7I7_ONCMY|nr:unnamed protein product [Oncorhynchus mykiss]